MLNSSTVNIFLLKYEKFCCLVVLRDAFFQSRKRLLFHFGYRKLDLVFLLKGLLYQFLYPLNPKNPYGIGFLMPPVPDLQ